MKLRRVAVVSYRLGGIDGVSVEAAKWIQALRRLGLDVISVAGGGRADRIVNGLDAWDLQPPDMDALRSALADSELVVAENICSLPLNRRAFDAVSRELVGRPAVLHHHDLPWQRSNMGDQIADDPSWVHVTVNRLSAGQLSDRGIRAETIYNHFVIEDPDDGTDTRRRLGVPLPARLVLQPTRAIARKNIAVGLAVAADVGATYWLTGPAEEGYEDQLHELLEAASVPVVHRPAPSSMAEAYGAADAVVFPSSWEGFGNPAVEASIHCLPVVVGTYPVAAELEEELGFRWFHSGSDLAGWLAHPDPAVLENNRSVAAERLDVEHLPGRLKVLLAHL